MSTCIALSGCQRPLQISPPGHLAHELSLASDGRQLVAAWHGGDHESAIWVHLLNEAGKPGSSIRLTDGKRDAYEADIQFFEGDLLVAWYEKDAAGASSARLGRFSQQGQPRWQIVLSAPEANGRNAVVRVHGDEALVAWLETPADGEPAVWTAKVGSDGTYLQAPQRRAAVSADTWNLNVAVSAQGYFYIVYDAHIGSRARELHLLTIAADGASEHLLSADDGHDSTYPDVSLSGEQVAVTWLDSRDGNSEVYLFAGRVSDLNSAVDARGTRITRNAGDSTGAYAAWNGNRLGLVWCDDSTGQYEIFRQDFDANAVSLGRARRLTHNHTQSFIPAIVPWRAGFALAWNEYEVVNETGHTRITTSTAVVLATE